MANKSLKELGLPENAEFELNYNANKYWDTVNDWLCDYDVIPSAYASHDTFKDGFYLEMMNRWNNTKTLDDVHLIAEHIFKIEKNYDQNMRIFNAVLRTKKYAGKEQILFHGTTFANITKILNTGFNRDYNITSVYGKGTYFSNEAKIAAQYCTPFDDRNVYAMLACRVYTGDSTVGSMYMRRDELYKEDKVTQYDSLVNDIDNPTIFAINRDYHAVPLFLIIFTARDNEEEES